LLFFFKQSEKIEIEVFMKFLLTLVFVFSFSISAYSEVCSLQEFSVRCPCPATYSISCGNKSGYLYNGEAQAKSIDVQFSSRNGSRVVRVELNGASIPAPWEIKAFLKDKGIEYDFNPKYSGQETPIIISADFSTPPKIYTDPKSGVLVSQASKPGKYKCFGGDMRITVYSGPDNTNKALCAAKAKCAEDGKPAVESVISCPAVSVTLCPSINDCANDTSVDLNVSQMNMLYNMGSPAKVKENRGVK